MRPPEFAIDRHPEPDGSVRLIVYGELDIATAGRLAAALEQLREARVHVRLDLSSIAFVDSTGLGVIVAAKRHAESDGWSFEVDRNASGPARRLFNLAGIETYIWR